MKTKYVLVTQSVIEKGRGKYHTECCSNIPFRSVDIFNYPIRITIGVAKKLGLVPCKSCFKDILKEVAK